MYERIIVALDGSETADEALPYATALARRFGSTLYLLTAAHTQAELAPVASPALARDAAISQDVVARENAEIEQAAARKHLSEVGERLRTEGILVETRVREGSPAREIVETAEQVRADVIILTAFGAGGAHTRSERAVFGGVADEVLRGSSIPVLLIRPEPL